MGKKLAITEKAHHVIAKKLFATDEKRVHRKVKKAFLTVGGVHRLAFSSGSVWTKHSCSVIDRTHSVYTRTSENVGETAFDSLRYDSRLYTNYDFWMFGGFEGVGSSHGFASIEDVDESSVVGMYIVRTHGVYEITSLDGIEGDYYNVICKIVDACDEEVVEEFTYTQGAEVFGTFEAEDGELPEAGELVEGSPTDEHCVLIINGEHFYYVREE